MSDTPRTDALTDADFKNIDEDMETATLQAYNRLHDLCAELERELAEAREEISDLQGDVEAWKRETMIVNARLRGEKHPDDNGAISTKEIIPKLQRELAEARSMTEGQWLLKVAARLVTAGCKSDGIVDAMDELIQQRDTLAEALETVLDEVRNDYMACKDEVKAALAAVKGGSDD